MSNILVINSSVRFEHSNSRQLTQVLLEKLSTERHGVKHRDLVKQPVPHFDHSAFSGFGGDDSQAGKKACELSDELIGEVKDSEIIIIGAPVYNFSIPTTLKAWIDYIARVGVTFNYTEQGPVGYLDNKKVYIVLARGGGSVEHIEMQLSQTLGMLGMKDITFIHAANLDTPEGAEGLADVHAQIDAICH
ncbi:NAD(P)H-dependent oxidoreductase [Endozoicomonas gorgoniicola]|uniref:FMN dependent NADH:quinone oxidoreductase n=1 Tax=Endozoicomonas gorgoniicola TaxID=1234144 RepID=A0ABT3MXE6_9GAMM|nr:NAD(P)H-dependent oxidoreductase [Endozoicomonas gorgoniicola]MCW7554057.1 NAD(P)H-dependent oxidoreductase [Endozoicomonas gorgoniicola]